ncbi:MAG: DUF4493 domain-containing protein [Barnesiella sp.]|nr:DUF4493 domain-containing protein [Barnesiella sp.]
MKKIKYILSAIIVAAAGCFAGCSDDYESITGRGRVHIKAQVESDVKVVSRASTDDLNENILLYISGQQGLIRKYKGISEIPADGIALVAGSYVAEAWAGDSVSASWDARFYKTYHPFNISGNELTLNLRLTIANVLASVKYADEVDAVLSDYTLTVSHPRGSLTFEGKDERVGSFMMPSATTDLEWKLQGTDMSGKEYTKTGVIKNVEPAHQYNLNIQYTPDNSEVGGGYISVVVDKSEVVVDKTIYIIAPPVIQGVGFDINETFMGEPGNVGHKALFVSASAELTSVILDFDELDELLGISDVEGTGIDLLKMSDDIKNLAEQSGLTFTYETDAETDLSTIKINFDETLMNSLSEGEHEVEISASLTDGDNIKTTERVWKLHLTADPVTVTQVPAYDVWATTATISGPVNKDDVTEVNLLYRPVTSRADDDWTSVAATIAGKVYTAVLTGLQPATRYEYYAVANDYSSPVFTFTTEDTPALPNGSFEEWGMDGKAIIPASSTDNLYWDSGNHGSATMSKNITESSTDYVVDGNYSARLQSQFVGIGSIGKFAAGNIFIGKYLATDGMDGILGWGRTFTARPKALKGYVKYTPAAVDNTSNDVSEVKKGDLDQGIIYIALLDNTLENANSNKVDNSIKEWPVIVKTKSSERKLFNPNGSNVIAYGELRLKEATSGEHNGMKEFTIPLEYKKKDVIPSNIMVVCSASAYGDYFVGGSSEMYIDNFTLEY